MPDCCSSHSPDSNSTRQSPPRSLPCPKSRSNCLPVPYTTVLQHIKSPWTFKPENHNFYFCADPDCDIVYFTADSKTLVTTNQVRTPIGCKQSGDDSLVCYCFGITRAQAGSAKIRDFVIEQTRSNGCACTSCNPSGRCCLKDFPKPAGK